MRKFVRVLVVAGALLPLSLAAQHNGTVVGSPAFGASSPSSFGQAAYGFSDNDYIALPSGACPTATVWTEELRMQASNYQSSVRVVTDCGGGSNGDRLWVGLGSNGHLEFADGNGGPYDSGLTLPTGPSYHYVRIVRTATAITPYLDCAAGTAHSGTYASLPTTSGTIGNFTTIATGFAYVGAVDEVRFSNGDMSQSGCTVPTAPYTGTEANTVSLYHLDGNAIDSTGGSGGGGTPTTTIDPSNAAILYSPGNWNVVAGSASSINAGAYFRTIFSGTSAALTFNTANLASPVTEIACRVDSGPFAITTLAPSLSLASGLQNRNHLLECIFNSSTETQNGWNIPSATMMSLTGLVLDSGATVAAVQRKSKILYAYGDSITECVRVFGTAAANDTDRNSALACYSAVLNQLDAEVGVIAFGGTGLSVAGSRNVPPLPQSWNYLYSGVLRPLSPAPDVVLLNEGTNDGSTNIVAAYTGVVQAMQAAWPSAKFLLMRPFGGNQAANVQAVAAATGATYVDTAGWFNPATDSVDGTHPYGYVSFGVLGPKLLPYVTGALYPTGQARSYTFY